MSKNTVPISASGQAITGSGTIERVLVTASSSGVIKLVDSPNSATGRVILDNLSVAAKDNLELNFDYTEGVFFVLVSGTATVQLGFSPSIN